MKSPQIFKKFPRSLSIPYHVGENPGHNSKLRTNPQCQKSEENFPFCAGLWDFGSFQKSQSPWFWDFRDSETRDVSRIFQDIFGVLRFQYWIRDIGIFPISIPGIPIFPDPDFDYRDCGIYNPVPTSIWYFITRRKLRPRLNRGLRRSGMLRHSLTYIN